MAATRAKSEYPTRVGRYMDFPVHSYGGDTGLILDRSAHKVVDSEDGTHLAQQTEPNRSSLHNMLMLGTVGVRIL